MPTRCPKGTHRNRKTGDCDSAKKTTKKRCPKGTYRNEKTGICEKYKRCPKGTHRNRKTGDCEPSQTSPKQYIPISPDSPPPKKYIPKSPDSPPPKKYVPRSPELPPPILKKEVEVILPSKSEIREFREDNIFNPKIVLPEPISIPKKVKSQMDYLSRRQKQFTEYEGNYDISCLFYLYLLNKYKSNCLIYDTSNKYSIYGRAMYSTDHYDIGLTLDFRKMSSQHDKSLHYRHLDNVAKQIAKCVTVKNSGCEAVRVRTNSGELCSQEFKQNSEIIIIPLWLIFNATAHANVMIYRKATNTVEHFEPHGESFSYDPHENKPIDDALIEFMTILNKHLPDVQFKPANQVCVNMMGLQNAEAFGRPKKKNEGGGYCAAWSMFFTELALKNPTIPSNELLEIIYNQMMDHKQGFNYLTQIIQGYSYYIQEKLEKYYAILFGQPLIYAKLLKKDPAFQRDFAKRMLFLVRIETMAINHAPWYDLNEARDYVTERIASTKHESFKEDYRLELEVYDKLIAAKQELSPMRDLLDDSVPSAKSKTTKKGKQADKRCPKGTRRNKKTGNCEPV